MAFICSTLNNFFSILLDALQWYLQALQRSLNSGISMDYLLVSHKIFLHLACSVHIVHRCTGSVTFSFKEVHIHMHTNLFFLYQIQRKQKGRIHVPKCMYLTYVCNDFWLYCCKVLSISCKHLHVIRILCTIAVLVTLRIWYFGLYQKHSGMWKIIWKPDAHATE